MAHILKTKPEFLGNSVIHYGGKITDTGHFYNYRGKIYHNEGVLFVIKEMAVEAAGKNDIVFQVKGGWVVASPYRGKIHNKRGMR